MTVFIIVSIILLCCIIAENICIFITHTKITHKNCPCELENKRIAFVSDLHINKSAKTAMRAVKKIKAQNPDVIFIAGDFVSRHIKNIDLTKQVLRELSSICRVYISIGNHELDLSEDLFLQLCKAFEESGVILLDNSHEKLSESAYIYGISCRRECYTNPNGGYSNLYKYTEKDMNQAVGEKSEFSIVLAHNPLFFETYETWGADIVLSGHIHGGSVRIPFLCGLLSPERKFFPKYSSGIYRIKDSVMFVGRGIAKPRIFSPKHIVILNFSKSE